LQERSKAFCGATLISRKWAITAAHCIEDFANRTGGKEAFTSDRVELLFGMHETRIACSLISSVHYHSQTFAIGLLVSYTQKNVSHVGDI